MGMGVKNSVWYTGTSFAKYMPVEVSEGGARPSLNVAGARPYLPLITLPNIIAHTLNLHKRH